MADYAIFAFVCIAGGALLVSRLVEAETSKTAKLVYSKWAGSGGSNGNPQAASPEGKDARDEEVAALRGQLEFERSAVARLVQESSKRDSELADLDEAVETLKQHVERAHVEKQALQASLAAALGDMQRLADDKARVENAVKAQGPLEVAAKQAEALRRLSHTLAWGDAIDVMVVGTGTPDAAHTSILDVMSAWGRRQADDKQQACARAMESGSLAALVAALDLPAPADTPLIAQARRQLEFLGAAEELERAVEEEDEGKLQQALARVRALGQPFPPKVLEAGLATLARVSQLKRLELAVTPDAPAADLFSALSCEMWTWQPEDGGTRRGELIREGLERWDARVAQQDVQSALDSRDPHALEQAVRRAHAALLSVAEVPQLRTAAPLVALQRAHVALGSALRRADDPALLQSAISMAQGAGVQLREEEEEGEAEAGGELQVRALLAGEEGSALGPEIGQALQECAMLARRAHARVLELESAAKLKAACATDDIEEMRCASLSARRLVAKGWIQESDSLARTECLVRERAAVELLEHAIQARMANADVSGNARYELLALAAALEVCERNGVPRTQHVFALGKAAHAEALDALLKDEGLQSDEDRTRLIAMGLEFIDDLSLLTEGDLRQAGVPRITVRKVLPRLLQVGREAAEVCAKTHVQFEERLKG